MRTDGATIIRENVREWYGNCVGKWTVSSRLKARYAENVAFRGACKLRSVYIASARGPRPIQKPQSCHRSVRFFSRKRITLDTILKTGCSAGYHPDRKSLTIVSEHGVALVVRQIDFGFASGRRIRSM